MLDSFIICISSVSEKSFKKVMYLTTSLLKYINYVAILIRDIGIYSHSEGTVNIYLRG